MFTAKIVNIETDSKGLFYFFVFLGQVSSYQNIISKPAVSASQNLLEMLILGPQHQTYQIRNWVEAQQFVSF